MGPDANVFINCDRLDGLPEPNRNNYLFELDWLAKHLPVAARVLQIGSMDGTRIVLLFEKRPDLHVTGLEIESELVELARKKVKAAGVKAEFLVGDITRPPALPQFEWVLCLNNTLGYISDQNAAIQQMRRLGEKVVISVYGEKFDRDLARAYFAAVGLPDDGGVRCYTRAIVDRWGGQITATPLGYLAEIATP